MIITLTGVAVHRCERRGPPHAGGAAASSAALVHSPRVRRRVRTRTGPVPRARRTTHAAAASAIGVSKTAAAHSCRGHTAARERTQDYAVLAAGRVHLPLGAQL